MKLSLDPLDLKPEFQQKTDQGLDQAISSSLVTFERLNEAAQAAVKAVGRGVFYAWDNRTYNAIYPPKE